MKRPIILSAVAALLVSCAPQESQTLTVVPYPNEVSIQNGTFDAAGADFHYSAEFDTAAQNIIKGFADRLSLVSGKDSKITEGDSTEGFVFLYDASMPEEAYRLEVSGKTATVTASSLRGVNYAVQTIKQMLPAAIYGKEKAEGEWTLQCVMINDEPRFGIGAHIHTRNIE